MKLITTRKHFSVDRILPVSGKKPIKIDQFGRILDGHHTYYSHLIYATPLIIEEWNLHYLGFIPIDYLLLHETTSLENYDQEDLDEILNKPCTIRKQNGLYIVEIGVTRIRLRQEQGLEYVESYLVK